MSNNTNNANANGADDNDEDINMAQPVVDKDFTFTDDEDETNDTNQNLESNMAIKNNNCNTLPSLSTTSIQNNDNAIIMDVDNADNNHLNVQIASTISKPLVTSTVKDSAGREIGQIKLSEDWILDQLNTNNKEIKINGKTIEITAKTITAKKPKRSFEEIFNDSRQAASNNNVNVISQINHMKTAKNTKALKVQTPKNAFTKPIRNNNWFNGQISRRNRLAMNLRKHRTFQGKYVLASFPHVLFADDYTARVDLTQKQYNKIMRKLMDQKKQIGYDDYCPVVCPYPIKISGEGIEKMQITHFNKWTRINSITDDSRNIKSFLTPDNGEIEIEHNYIIFIQHSPKGGLIELLERYCLDVGETLENVMKFDGLQINLELLRPKHIYTSVTFELHSEPTKPGEKYKPGIKDLSSFNCKLELSQAINNKIINTFQFCASRKQIRNRNYDNINLSDIFTVEKIPIYNHNIYEINLKQLQLTELFLRNQAHYNTAMDVKIRNKNLSHPMGQLPMDPNNTIEKMIEDQFVTTLNIHIDDYSNILRGDCARNVRRVTINNINKYLVMGIDMDILDQYDLDGDIKCILNNNLLQLSIGNISVVETPADITIHEIYKNVMGICEEHKELGPLHGSKCTEKVNKNNANERQIREIYKTKSTEFISKQVKYGQLKWCKWCGISYKYSHKCLFANLAINPFDGGKDWPFSMSSSAFVSRCGGLTGQCWCQMLKLNVNEFKGIELVTFQDGPFHNKLCGNCTLDTLQFIDALNIKDEEDDNKSDDIKVEINYDKINKRLNKINNYKQSDLMIRNTVYELNINDNTPNNGFVPASTIIN